MNSEELKAKLQALINNKGDEELIQEDALVLMSGYLAEIERLQHVLGFTKKDIAEKINTSASYLTQVFRGDKPLNFITIAKLQKALEIRFQIQAVPMTKSLQICDETKFFDAIHNYKAGEGVWMWKNVNFKTSYNAGSPIPQIDRQNESKAISA